jgi:hypothetical protein
MTFNLNDQFKKVLKIFKKRRQAAIEYVRDPIRDWGIMVIVFTFLFIGVVIGNIIFFQKINSGTFGNSNNSIASNTAIDRETLKKVVDYYAAREKKLSELKESPPTLVDPSR